MIEIKNYLEEISKLLPVGTSISYTDAERRAGIFLEAQAKIANWRHLLSNEKVKLLSTQTAVYSEQMSKGTAKTVTENKLTAEASLEYTNAREEFERIDNDINYLKAYYEIFKDAHVFYRQMCREGHE